MNTQPIELRLADDLEKHVGGNIAYRSAAELRRLHEENTAARKAIEKAEQWDTSDMAHRSGGLSVEQALDGLAETSWEIEPVANRSDCGHKEFTPLCQMCMSTKPEKIDTSAERVHETDKSVHEDDDIQEYKRPWVGLTNEEIKGILDCGRGGLVDIKKAEQILKEKNNG